MAEALCEDEGCPQAGTEHVCTGSAKSVTVSQDLLDRMIEGLDAFRGALPNRKHGEVMTLHDIFTTLKNLRSACN